MGEHGLGPYLPFPGTCPGFQGSKNDSFFGSSGSNGSSAPGYTALSLISQRIRLIKPHKYTANFFSSYCKLFCIFPEIEGFENQTDDGDVVTRVKGYIGELFVFFYVLFS